MLVGVNTSDSDFNTAEKTGGNKTHLHSTGNHTLTTNEIPKHEHEYINNLADEGNVIPVGGTSNPVGAALKDLRIQSFIDGTDQTGGGAAHNHGNTGGASSLPPYITCYMWKRTA